MTTAHLTPDDQIDLAIEVATLYGGDLTHLDLLDDLACHGYAFTDTPIDGTADRAAVIASASEGRITTEALIAALAAIGIADELADLENWQMLASRAYFQILTGRPIALEECLR